MNNSKPHVYAKHIKNKNLQGYVACMCVPFLRLHDAEAYCTSQGYEPDKDHLTRDVQWAKNISAALIPELRRMNEILDAETEQLAIKLNVLSDKQKRYQNMHSIWGDVESKLAHEEWKETYGRYSETMKIKNQILERIYELQSILRLQKEG